MSGAISSRRFKIWAGTRLSFLRAFLRKCRWQTEREQGDPGRRHKRRAGPRGNPIPAADTCRSPGSDHRAVHVQHDIEASARVDTRQSPRCNVKIFCGGKLVYPFDSARPTRSIARENAALSTRPHPRRRSIPKRMSSSGGGFIFDRSPTLRIMSRSALASVGLK